MSDAVEPVGHLEPQRVARAESAGSDALGLARLHERLPQLRPCCGGAEELEAVLARCSRCARPCKGRRPRLPFGESIASRPPAGARWSSRCSTPAARGPCTASCAQASDSFVTSRAEGMAVQPVEVLLRFAALTHDEEVVRRATVDDHVVHDAALVPAQAAILRLAIGAAREVVGEEPLQRIERLRAAEDDLAHVRDVEEADALAHRCVLGEDALRTGPASPSRRTRRSARRRERGRRRAACAGPWENPGTA